MTDFIPPRSNNIVT